MRNYLRVLRCLFVMLRRLKWSRSQILEYQNRELKRVVRYAYSYVPFYHEVFKKLGVKPEDIHGISDLKRLPIIKKYDVRQNLSRIVSSEFNVDSLIRLSTSGSTGQPLPVFISDREDDFRKAKHLKANIVCGQRPRDKYVTITSPSHFGEVPMLSRILRMYSRSFVSVFDSTPNQLLQIERMKPDILAGYSSSLWLLAKEVQERRIKVLRPRLIFGGAEMIDSVSRSFVERVFSAPFYDQYATIEFERMAWQCMQREQYHIDSDAVVMEFLDENGEAVASGESGEVVCTSLFSYAMPFIRYAVGDVGVPSDDVCSCGIGLPLMKVIEGRKDSLICLPDGRMLSPRIFTVTMNMSELASHIDQFRIVQKRMDLFRIEIKKKADSINEGSMASSLIAHLKRKLKLDMYNIDFEVEFVKDIPLDKSGKLMAVVSELDGYTHTAQRS
jgi:phenylacetate-CoA ligase